jgi:hypothetical protein
MIEKVISLIFTVHEERGNANVAALLAILEKIQPEVIFLELPPNSLEQFLQAGSRGNLESAAVQQYQMLHNVELFAVDLPPPDDAFFDNYRHLQDIADNKSSDSRRLITWHRNYIRAHGFAYLNSDHCGKICSDIAADEHATLLALDDPRLFEISEQWRQTNDFRESEMMMKIHQHCRDLSFSAGAFLIGAGHRQGIIDKSQQYSLDPQYKVRWEFGC